MSDLSEMARKMGKRGGKTTLKKHGAEHFKRISKLGVKARRKDQSSSVKSL